MGNFLFILLIPLFFGIFLHSVRVSRRFLDLIFVGASFLQICVVIWVFLTASWVETTSVWQLSQWIQLTFQFEPIGALFIFLVSILWCLTSLYCVGYMRKEPVASVHLFYAYFLLSVFSALWIGFSGDLLTMFIGYELLTFLTYPLVVSKGSFQAKKAARYYLIMLLGSSLLFLLAVLIVQANYGTLLFSRGGVFKGDDTFLPIALMGLFLWGVGKAALMPMHIWLPKAMVAPTPVSAFLHAVAVVKSGVFCLIKIGVYIFDFDFLKSHNVTDYWLWLPALTLLLTGFWAILQDDIKKRLAFSTVSQLAYITLGWMLLDEFGLLGSMMQMLAHAFAKITLFFVAGMIYVRYHVSSLKALKGLGYQMPLSMSLFSIASLSIVGMPFTIGFWGKFSLLFGVLRFDHLALLFVLVLGSIFSMIYLFQVVYVAFQSDKKKVFVFDSMPILCIVPAFFSGLACIALFLAGPFLMGFLSKQLGLFF